MASSFAKRNIFKIKKKRSILTFEMGQLVPVWKKEVYPGDTMNITFDYMARLAAMLAPTYDMIDAYLWSFFVPYRTVWDDFEEFITGYNIKTKQESTAVFPYITVPTSSSDFQTLGSLPDYLSFPVKNTLTNSVKVSALPYRVYAKIFNDWFLNEYIQNEIAYSTASGADTTTSTALLNKTWPRDYFTSALPFTQVGNPVTLPIFANANIPINVYGTGKQFGLTDTTASTVFGLTGGGNTETYFAAFNGNNIATSGASKATAANNNIVGVSPDATKSGLTGSVNLYTQTTLTVEEVRQAFQLQRMKWRAAQTGSRMVEYIAGVFGVRSPDMRLQRAEFLGGSKSPILVSEIIQTSESSATSPQGNMAGHGFGANATPRIKKSFTEHGLVMTIMCVMPRATYSQGLPRHDMGERTRYDFLQPEFAHLGEQPIYQSEIYLTGTSADAQAFGYQPRYEDFRREISEVHGDFRDNMSYWYFGRTFANAPALNSTFLSAVPSKTPFAAGNQATRPVWVEFAPRGTMIRPLPRHGQAGLIDH